MFGCGDRASRADRLREDPFLCFDDNEGERLLVTGELLCLGGGEWETRRFGGGDGDALRLGGGGGEAVLLFGGGEGEYLLCIGGEYLLGEGEQDVEEETEAFVVLVVWKTCVDEAEEQEENVAFWREMGRDFSSVYHERNPLSGAFKVMERHSRKGNVSITCLPHHSSHGTFWVVHLLRKRRSQNLKLHNKQKFTSDVCLTACTRFWKVSRGSIQINKSSSLI